MTRQTRGQRQTDGPRAALAQAHRLLFPAAAFAALAGVAYKAAGYGGLAGLPRIAAPYWHGHEMIFGFAYALIAGYLVTRRSGVLAASLFGAWLAGRAAFLMPALPNGLTAVAALCFPALIFVYSGVPFLRAARKGRNVVFAPLIGGLFAAELVFQLGALDAVPEGRERGLVLGTNLVALLLFAMGGRVIAAATSGALQKLDKPRPGVAHPRLDRIGVLALAGIALLDLFKAPPELSAALGLVAGLVVLARLLLWRVWRTVRQTDLSLLHLGYGFLGIGLIYAAAARMFGFAPHFEATHGVMVGALGTLAAVMMVRVTLQRLRRPIALPPLIVLSVGLIAVSFVSRIAAIHGLDRLSAIWVAGAAWSAAFLFVLLVLMRLVTTVGPKRE